MSKIPPEILQYKTRGVEIKKIGKKYFAQRITCKWIPETKKRKKVILEYLGEVTADGIIPKKHRRISVETPYSIEFGASWILRNLTSDILENLTKHFGDIGKWLYVIAMIRCIKHCAFRYIEHFYNVSYLSVLFPNLSLSSSKISNEMSRLGFFRKKMIDFMKDFIPANDFYVIFDGTSIVCNSQYIAEAQRGYNSHGCYDPQLNLMYALAVKNEKLCPIFYKRYPGSIRDVSAFKGMLKEMGLGKAVILADKGFYSFSNSEELDQMGLPYILPLRRNSKEYSREALLKPGLTGFHGRFLYNKRMIWYYSQPVTESDKCRYFLFLDETLQHLETNSRLSKHINTETREDVEKFQQEQLYFGTFVLKSTLMELNAEETYRLYKTREDVEQLFDIYKEEEDFKTTGMQSSESLETALFLNHLSTMMVYRIYNRLRQQKQLSKYSATKVCDLLYDIKAIPLGREYQLEPIPKLARQNIEALGFKVPIKVE